MNQILVTEKLYVTPELKRKKNFYKIEFFLSVFLFCMLISFYIYAEYDRTKSEETGKMMLTSAETALNDANRNVELNEEEEIIWTFVLGESTNTDSQTETQTETTNTNNEAKTEERVAINQETYYDSKKEPYTIIAKISIPKLGVEYAVLSRTTDELLKINPTRLKDTEPNEVRKSLHCRA